MGNNLINVSIAIVANFVILAICYAYICPIVTGPLDNQVHTSACGDQEWCLAAAAKVVAIVSYLPFICIFALSVWWFASSFRREEDRYSRLP